MLFGFRSGRPDRCMAYQSFVNLDLTLPVAKWPEPGLEIEWALPQEPDCILPVDCRGLKGSRCLPVPGRVGQQRCFCRVGQHWDPTTGLCQSKFFFFVSNLVLAKSIALVW